MANDRRAALDAEREVLDLEDELAAAKESGGADMGLKLRLREARRTFRSFREGAEPAEGVARPATIETGSEVL
jgi:hypothetical protein